MPRARTRYVGNQVTKKTCVELPPNCPRDAPRTCRCRSSVRCGSIERDGLALVVAAAPRFDVVELRPVGVVLSPGLHRAPTTRARRPRRRRPRSRRGRAIRSSARSRRGAPPGNRGRRIVRMNRSRARARSCAETRWRGSGCWRGNTGASKMPTPMRVRMSPGSGASGGHEGGEETPHTTAMKYVTRVPNRSRKIPPGIWRARNSRRRRRTRGPVRGGEAQVPAHEGGGDAEDGPVEIVDHGPHGHHGQDREPAHGSRRGGAVTGASDTTSG